MDCNQAQECFVFLPATQARSPVAANEQKSVCSAQTLVPHPLQRKGREPSPACWPGPARRPSAAAPWSLPTTGCLQDALPSLLPSSQGWRGGTRLPARGWVLRGGAEKSNAETQGPQWLGTAFLADRLMGSSGQEGGTTGRAAGSGRRKENEIQIYFIVPASHLPGTCQHKHLPFMQVHSPRSSEHLNVSFLGSSPQPLCIKGVNRKVKRNGCDLPLQRGRSELLQRSAESVHSRL